MLSHQLQCLIAELRRPDYHGLTPDEAFKLLAYSYRWYRRVLETNFWTQEQLDKTNPKLVPDNLMIVDAKLAEQFPNGIPGMPNKLRREWFDRAWQESR